MFLLTAVAVAVVVAAVGGYLLYRGRRSLPQIEGAAQLRGLTAPVEVIRDRFGVPHLYGTDIRDLARAMGYVHAQDRYFQMELARRSGAGRLAEILGAGAGGLDRQVRRAGLTQAALSELERMAPEARETLEAYASGVNAYRDANLDRLPPEFELLELVPEAWKAEDSLVIGKWMAFHLSFNGRVEMLRSNLADVVGLEAAYRLTGLEPQDSEPQSARIDLLDDPAAPWGVARGASNAWVISGQHSSSGRPLLASDPHLPLAIPSVWYEIHLSGGGYDVAGASLPGAPLVLLGRNSRIAWAVTALFADAQDLYFETVHPEDSRLYAVGEEWRTLDVVTETINVKDGSPVVEDVQITRHGTVIGTTTDGRLVAQRWDALWNGDHILALLRLNRAGSWQEFTDALATWSSPALSFLYADSEGNIGFFPAGDVPVRAGFDGSFPVDGSSGQQEWAGVIPHELKPIIFNPDEGAIVSANQQMLPPETPYPLGADTIAPFRADRIRNLLRTGSSLGLEDFARIQSDRYDASTEAVLRHIVALKPTDPRESGAVELLRNWNGRMTRGAAPAVYQAVYHRLLENTFRDELGEETFHQFLEFVELGFPGGLHAIVDDESSRFWDDGATPDVEARRHIFLKSLTEAVALLTERLGDDVSSWDWGVLHGVHFRHPLAVDGTSRWLLNRGPVPFGGSTHTIANAVVSLRKPFETVVGTSFRLLVDLSDPDNARSVVSTGASGHPLSAHYFDQNRRWLEGDSHPLLSDRSAVEGAAEAKLLLQP